MDGEERDLSPLVVFISAFFFSFFLSSFFLFFILVQCSMKQDEGRGDEKAAEGCGGHGGILLVHRCFPLRKGLISPAPDQFD